MNSPFSRDSVELPFKHVLVRTLPESRDIKQIYAQEVGGKIEIFEEHYVRGDPVGSPTRKLETLAQGGKMQVWAIPLSFNPKQRCIVFAPKDFEIANFRDDLVLLFMLVSLGSFCGRRAFLDEWEDFARFLAGNRNWGMTQGWWYTTARVVVVSYMNENHRLLSNTLVRFVGDNMRLGDSIELKLSAPLAEQTFKKASSILTNEMTQNPWKDSITA